MFEKVVKAIEKTKTFAPRFDTLIPIEEKHLEESLRKIIKPEFLSVLSRKPTVYRGGYPIQTEVAIAYGGDAGQTLANNEKKMEIMRFANKAPLLFDNGACAITKAVNSVDWKRYGIKDIENQPITILVNLSSVHIPYTSAGKQAIADEDEIVEEIRKALMTAARSLGIHISKKRGMEIKMKKKGIFLNYAKELAEGLHLLTERDKKELYSKLEEVITHKLKLEELEGSEENQDPEEQEETKEKKKGKITDFFGPEGDNDE
jgi:DNA topoisomerase-6 subunit B